MALFAGALSPSCTNIFGVSAMLCIAQKGCGYICEICRELACSEALAATDNKILVEIQNFPRIFPIG